jgi:hypothetical protein
VIVKITVFLICRDLALLNLCFQAFKDLWALASMQNVVPQPKQGEDQRKQRKRVDKKLTALLKKL